MLKGHLLSFFILILSLKRDGPLEITGGGVTIPKKIPARETCLKRILQAVIPESNKTYALESNF